MPLHQHSGHLCRQTTGDCTHITGDGNQTPVIAKKWRLWQLSRPVMHWKCMQCHKESWVHSSFTGLYYLNLSFSTPVGSKFQGLFVTCWKVWLVTKACSKSDKCEEQPVNGRQAKADHIFNIQAHFSMRTIICFYIFTVKCQIVLMLFTLVYYFTLLISSNKQFETHSSQKPAVRAMLPYMLLCCYPFNQTHSVRVTFL